MACDERELREARWPFPSGLPDQAMSFVNADTTSPADPECRVAADEPARAVAVRGEVAVDLPMRHAGTQRLLLRYELQGHDGAPVVFVAGGISASRHVASSAEFPGPGWAEDLLGAGRTLSPQRLRVLSFDFIGAEGDLDVPIDTADQADAIVALLDALGIARLCQRRERTQRRFPFAFDAQRRHRRALAIEPMPQALHEELGERPFRPLGPDEDAAALQQALRENLGGRGAGGGERRCRLLQEGGLEEEGLGEVFDQIHRFSLTWRVAHHAAPRSKAPCR